MWSSAPVSRVLIPFVCGIIACIFLEIYMITIPAILFVGFAIPFVGLHIFSAKINYKFLWLGGVFMSLSLVALGGLIVGMNKLDTRPDFFANALEKKDFVEVKISEPLVEKEKTWKGIGDVKYVLKNGKEIPASGKILLYFRKDSLAPKLRYGDIVIVRNKINKFQPPRNPQEFDLRGYMKWNNVYHNAFLSPADWIFTGVNEGKAFYKFIYGTRQKFTESFTKYVGGEDEQGLVRALVLGDETDISKELISSYAGTGTLHVLSVSGLHVGLIFIVLSFIFKFLKRGKFGNQIFVLLMLIILWGYAFLTGMSPSVARSVVMFSFVLIGMAFQRQNNIFNSICISALVLLVDDPFLIARTSFQLSYVALLGIVSLHPHIYKWVEIPEKEKRKWFTKWWAIDWVWSVVAVSLSAQLATMPLALFYFNAFPTWFILGNLIIIPWSSLVLLAGALFLVLSLFLPSAILAFFGKILFYLIHGLNTTVEGMDNLPFAHIEGIFINKTESLLVALLVFFLCAAFVRKNKYLLQTGLVFSLLFLSYHSINKFEMAKTNRLVIHNIPQSVSFSIKEKNKIHLFADTAFINNRYKTDYYYKRYSSSLGVAFSNVVKHSFFEEEKFASSSVFHSQNVLVFNGMPLAVLTPQTDWKTLPTLRYKYIMITGNPRLNLDKILANIKTESIIFTTDNSLPHIARWKASCIKAGVKTVDFREIKSIIIES